METLIQSAPKTLKDVYEMLPEGTLAELIENQLYMSPAPSFNHHRITKLISKQLDIIVEDKGIGIVIYAPFDVRLDQTANAVQPDIFVILKTNPNQVNDEGKFIGVPDLVVEILSKSNQSHYLIVKKNLYERVGVKEYWVVDSESKLALGFFLTENGYIKSVELTGKIESKLLRADFDF
jgi:Uma2 family endonuclease